ncbi:MAG: beta-lactamase [Flavipsychrobacter sp.]|jgi:metallo-beta-lactamase class B|nr:beta-lactamase [Flavipsychrobacter sp.]
MFRRLLPVAILVLLVNTYSNAQQVKVPTDVPAKWSQPYKPFRIVGNLYYVGTYELACYLIATPRGHILINTGCADSEPLICSNIHELGFKFSDIKILLTNQAHFDHVGAMAEVKAITGATMMVNKYDAKVLADGGFSDYLYGGKYSMFTPVKADRLLRNRDAVSLGNTSVFVLHHPGHTQGSTSFLADVQDGNRWYRVLIANMPTILPEAELPAMESYPHIAKDFEYTFDAMKDLKFDIWVAAHASQFDLHKKHKPGDAYNPEVFRDRAGYDAALDGLHDDYMKKLSGKK